MSSALIVCEEDCPDGGRCSPSHQDIRVFEKAQTKTAWTLLVFLFS